MSFIETSLQTGHPDEFSDAVAKMTASILQEQLAPIVETLREHARLLDLHAALLNHSTAMNRYNVGKIDDIRDFQNNIKCVVLSSSLPTVVLTYTRFFFTASNYNFTLIPRTDGIPTIEIPKHLQPAQALKHS